MKKTQKVFALIIAVLMVFSCFSMVVFAEEVEGITIVSAKITGENEYLLEFSSPIRFGRTYQIFRRQNSATSGGSQQNPKTVEYLTDETAVSETVGGKVYSTKVKLTFDAPAATFNRAKYAIVIAEYNNAGEEANVMDGKIAATHAGGPNGEILVGNHTANSLDFVYIPTTALDPKYTHSIRLENDKPITLLAAEVSADYTSYTLHFSDPVRIGSRYRNFFRTAPTGGSQIESSGQEYIDGIDFNGEIYSKTVIVKFNLSDTQKNGSENYTKYGITLSEYESMLPDHFGYIAPDRLIGFDSRLVAANYHDANQNMDILWIPTVADDLADTANYNIHLSPAGAPYVVGATEHADGKILVEFSEAVSFDAEKNAYLRLTNPVNTEGEIALTAAATDDAKVIEFTYDELTNAFADGNYGFSFAEDYITDADGNGITANYVRDTGNAVWIPTEAINDDMFRYGVTLDVHTETKTNYDETDHWTECECGAILGEKAPHDFETTNYDENGHWTECECGEKTEVIPHDFSVADKDDENHWFECECDYRDETTVAEHVFDKADRDETDHWTECECGAKNEVTPHLFETTNKDTENHWLECECGLIDETTVDEHDYSESETCPVCGQKQYTEGDLNGDDEVDADDAIHLLYHIFFPSQEDYAVNQPIDFNNDTEENADDAIYLLYHVFFKAQYPLFPEVEAE